MKTKYLLLVEDNADDELLTIRALKKSSCNIKVEVVRDGAEALDFLFCTGPYVHRDKEHKPELILLDLKLPKVDGIGVLNRLKQNEQTATIPVVILTTSSEQKDIASSYKCGANSFIRKPVDFEEFISTINKIGEYWLSLNQHISSRN